MQSVGLVFSDFRGINLVDQIQNLIKTMKQAQQERFGGILGKYGEWNEQAIDAYLPEFRSTAKQVAESGLQYIEICPAWLTDKDCV
ncbi:hypothetical protein SAMN04487973_101241 [Pediococcus ethanolidurans]|nr:hypothetical protein SAMN04487973_101241 [Pediococcus ethanolidurans]